MISSLAHALILGKPLIMYMGIITYLSLIFTATIAVLNLKFAVRAIPFKWHPRFAVLTIILASLHAILGISVYLGF
jgi:isoprenylcysteine carboxyl methyltransferase (ICMT) family protein YpbQ